MNWQVEPHFELQLRRSSGGRQLHLRRPEDPKIPAPLFDRSKKCQDLSVEEGSQSNVHTVELAPQGARTRHGPKVDPMLCLKLPMDGKEHRQWSHTSHC